MTNLSKHKINFTERFKRRHALRFHMSLILLATFSSGLLATKLMLVLDLTNVMWRYPLAVVSAYGVFFVSVKIWLHYISPSAAAKKAHDGSVDVGDCLPDLPISGGGGGHTASILEGGGGEFAGAGASGSFDVGGLADTASSPLLDGAAETGSGIGDVVGDGAGDAIGSVLGEEGGCLVAVIVGFVAVMLVVIIGSGAYLVYEAPLILSETAFEFILAASLLRGARRINSGDWLGSVFKTTRMPFLATLALAFLAGYLMHRYYPGVTCDGTTATFTPSGSLLANTTYTATITGAKDLAGNTLPSQSWTFTRGWFVLGTAPRVTSATPADHASNIAVTTTVAATFNVAMDAATITTGTFQLFKGTTSVAGTVSLNNAGTVATFTPSSQLAPNSTYTATITTGAKGTSGAPLATTTTWSFTTGISGDTIAPTVLTTVPAANGTGVAKSSTINITFSEGIDQASLTPSSIAITSAAGTVAGVLAVNSNNTDFTFTPSAALSPNTLYTVSVKGTLKDLAGNAFGADYTWTFTTGS